MSVAKINSSTNHDQLNLSIALLPWGNVIEDFLESIDLSLEEFCQEMTGGVAFWIYRST